MGTINVNAIDKESGSELVLGGSGTQVTLHASATSSGFVTDGSLTKGWIQFNGTGTIAIGDSFNVTSITDKGTGNYTVTWDTDFANATYSVVGMALGSQTVVSIESQVVGSCDIYTFLATTGGATDMTNVCLIAVGDQ